MAKYSYEFKKKIVLEYLNSDEGCISISRKYGMASSSQLLVNVNQKVSHLLTNF